MMKFFGFVAVFASLVFTTSGLLCLVCENARSNLECQTNGRVQQCQPNQQACQNEVRTDNIGLRITKRCKQAHACDNNFIQNPRPAWFPSQCNLAVMHTVCRCCCNTDRCNFPALGCLGARCDPAHTNPANGRVECTDSNNDQSVCSFTCNSGYELVGEDASTCSVVDDTGSWSSPAPTCRPTVCQPPQQAPFNGRVRCTNGNSAGSVCSFTCDAGYYLEGSSATTCLNDNQWSNRRPICVPIVCQPPQGPPIDGSIVCTDTNRLSSVCTFSCNDAYTLVGDTTRTCVDDLNGDALGIWTNQRPVCEPNVCQPPHTDPVNGGVSCTNENFQGSQCSFACNAGYSLVGNPVSTCTNSDGVIEWDFVAPVCEPIVCLPRLSDPANGQMSCSNENFVGSSCTFTCNANYALIGASEVVCFDDLNGDTLGAWSDPQPTCQPVVCEPAQANPANGLVDCTNSNFATSVCSFSCDAQYALVGAPTTVCADRGNGDALGVWSNPAPTCQLITCPPPHVAPVNGGVSCTSGNSEGSECTFTCDAGYALIGGSVSTCNDDGNGDPFGLWSSPAPTCQRIICLPEQTNPANGEVVCTDANNVNSVCTFGCNRGYARIGAEIVTCSDDGNRDALGAWSNPAPTCEPITCDPPQSSPGNGAVVCTNSNLMDSVCSFSCDPAFAMSGTPATTCLEVPGQGTVGSWSSPAPVCNPIVCEPPRDSPADGSVSCTNSNFLSSVCTYSCNDGFALVGTTTTVCVDDGNSDALGLWSDPKPVCTPIVCEPPQENPVNGAVQCSNSNLLGSTCTFSCDDSYALDGASEITCLEDGTGDPLGVWSNTPPVCNRKTCQEPPASPQNGFRVCTDGNFLGSQCEFGCNDYHTRVGPLYTNCVESANGNLIWDNPAPVCNPNSCDDQGELRHGNYSCSNDNLATSTCTFQCTGEGYKIYPPGVNENTCQNDTAWSVPKPCCARDCPPFALMDAAFILDSSSSIGAANWVLMKEFIRNVLGAFIVSDESARLAVFRYNAKVDNASQILLKDFDNIDDFLLKFDQIPYDGSGTRTGKALNYTHTTIFRPENGDRPNVKNVAVVITDGRSQDEVASISRQLRADGVLTFALGIRPPRGQLDVGQLNDIAGDPSRLLITEGSFDQLSEQLSAQLATQICGDPCFDVHEHAAASTTTAP